MSGIQNMLQARVNPILHESIQRVFEILGTETKLVYVMRGGEYLPAKIGFDLDVLLKSDSSSGLKHLLHNEVISEGSFCFRNGGNDKKFKLMVLVRSEKKISGMRNWVLFDFQSEVPVLVEPVLNSLLMHPRSIDNRRKESYLRPAAEESWTLKLLNCLSKGQVDQCLTMAAELAQFSSVQTERVFDLLNKSQLGPSLDSEILTTIALQKSIKSYVSGDRESGSGFLIRSQVWKKSKRKILSCIAQYVFFLPIVQPRLFVISGPDGVGKSSVCLQLDQLLDDLPLEYDIFHHTRYVKDSITSNLRADIVLPRSFFYRFFRFLWRITIPERVKKLTIAGLNETRYLYRINEKICRTVFEDKIGIADRYAYDRYVKSKLTGKPRWQTWLFLTTAVVAKKPRMIFLIQDNPDAVIERKQELSVQQIDDYQKSIHRVIKRLRVPHKLINVKGRKAEEVACEIFDHMLRQVGGELFSLSSAWEDKFRKNDKR